MSTDSFQPISESLSRQLPAQLIQRTFDEIGISSKHISQHSVQNLKKSLKEKIEQSFEKRFDRSFVKNTEANFSENIETVRTENIEESTTENTIESSELDFKYFDHCFKSSVNKDEDQSALLQNRGKCVAGNFSMNCCDTGYLDLSKSSTTESTADTIQSATDRKDLGCRGSGTNDPRWQTKWSVSKGLGEGIFFSNDILGVESKTRGMKFETTNPEKTHHRLIDLEYRVKQRFIPIRLAPESLAGRSQDNDLLPQPQPPSGLWFPKEAYNPKAYVSRHPQDNCGLAREVIIERLRVQNMDGPHIGKVLAELNVAPDEFYPPQVTPKEPILFVNYQKPKVNNRSILCYPGSPTERKKSVTVQPHLTANIGLSFASVLSSDRGNEQENDVGDTDFHEERSFAKWEYDLNCISPQKLKIPLGVAGPFFPLEMFDNEMYEVRTPGEWLRLGWKNSVHYPVPARAFLQHFQTDGEASETPSSLTLNNGTSNSKMVACWQDVGVRSYDPQNRVYIVSPVHKPDLHYRLPRIYICFRAEIATNFAQRVVDAMHRRRKQEAQLQYNLFVASIPLKLESFSRLDEFQMGQIIRSISRGNLKSISGEKQEALSREIESLHAQFSAKQIHRFNRERKDQMKLYHDTMCELENEFYFNLLEDTTHLPKATRGTIITGGQRRDFDDRVKRLKTKFLFVQRPIIEAMGIVIENCAQFDDEIFFVFDLPPLTLEDFSEVQILQVDAIMNIIRGEWFDNITQGLIERFSQAGTWYDIHVKRWDVYKISKLSVFVNLVKFNMESCIRNLLTRSIVQFSEFIAKGTRSKGTIQKNSKENQVWNMRDKTRTKTTFENHSQENHTWNSHHKETSSLDDETSPIFFITLSMSPEEGPFYTTPLEQFEAVLEQVILKPIDECHRIPQPEPRILTKFKYPKDTYLGSLGFLDRDATVPLEKMKSAIRSAVKPLREFAKNFEQYVEIYKIDVEEYVRDFESKNHPAIVVKKEIERRLNYLEKLENEIFEQVIMGPFYVDVTDLKNKLVGICRDLSDRLCESFEDRLSEVMREAMAPYEAWYAPLVETHQAVERYMEAVDNVDELLLLVQEQDKAVRRMQQDYEILDYFNYLMKEESYTIKYEALIWPYKIKVKLGAFVDKVEEELEKFKRIQIKDEMTLQEKLSEMFSLFTNLVETQDIGKIHEFGNEFRRAWKQLVELDAYSEVLNMRQDLLKLPFTPFDQTKELMAEFAPYKDFWTTASEFYKMLQQWTERPLTQLDLSNIKQSFQSFEEVIKYCEKHFESVIEMLQNVQSVKEEMNRFQDNDLPILNILMNPCMTDETWGEFGKAIGDESFIITEKMSLNKFLKIQNVAEHLDLLRAINERVNRECSGENEYDEPLQEPLEDMIDELNVMPLTESMNNIDESDNIDESSNILEFQRSDALNELIGDKLHRELEESISLQEQETDEVDQSKSDEEDFNI